MDELELANRFDRQRPQLRAVAYRILGSVSDADDAVQEAWLRLQRTDAGQIDSLERGLTTLVARICLNMLRSRRTRGDQPLDGLRPEPIIDDPRAAPIRPSGKRRLRSDPASHVKSVAAASCGPGRCSVLSWRCGSGVESMSTFEPGRGVAPLASGTVK
jgi:DNA-directed RNA polymerase specialized sigma24 family protein